MPQMNGMRGGNGGSRNGGDRGAGPMGGNGPMGGRGAEPRMGGMNPHMGGMEQHRGGMEPHMGGGMAGPRVEPRKPMRYGADPRHAAPFGLVVADVIWNRAHFNRIRRVLEKMTWNERITQIEERILWESFGRRIEYYEAQELLAWVDRELGYL